MTRPKNVNAPSPWNMRIWDVGKNEWLGQSDPEALTYYGFDIRGGEVAMMQGVDLVYKQIEYGRKFIWERSTGLIDKNGVEIYQGDIVTLRYLYYQDGRKGERILVPVRKTYEVIIDENGVGFMRHIARLCKPVTYWSKYSRHASLPSEPNPDAEVVIIGNIHENPELLEGKR